VFAKKDFLGDLVNISAGLNAASRGISQASEGEADFRITQAFGYTAMATVVRIGKLRVMVYSRDHPPPHVHVIAPRGQAKIQVDGPEGHPGLKWTFGLSRREIAQALAAVEDHRELILAEWERVHDHT
jgi:hypothetical protein